MRKGSKKPIGILPAPIDATFTAKEYNSIVDSNHEIKYVDAIESQLLDILTRLCDACHEMDNKTEPWSTIRKDIEKLR